MFVSTLCISRIIIIIENKERDVYRPRTRLTTINNKFRGKYTAHKTVSSSTLFRYHIHRGSKLSKMSSSFEINFSRAPCFFPRIETPRHTYFFYLWCPAAEQTNDFHESGSCFGRLEAIYPIVLLVTSMAHKLDKSFPLTVT